MRRTTPIDPVAAAALADRRRRLGVTQNELALALDLSEATISKIETARVPASAAVIAQIETALEHLAREAVLT